MPKNVLISSREFCRHIPSYSTTQAASNKGCLHSLKAKIVKKLAAAGYLTLFRDFKLACMIKTYRSASYHQVLKIRECYIC